MRWCVRMPRKGVLLVERICCKRVSHLTTTARIMRGYVMSGCVRMSNEGVSRCHEKACY